MYNHYYRYSITGRYKQWNGLMDWNTGLDYWTELFSFFGQVSIHLFFHFSQVTMDECSYDNRCLLQCFHRYI